MEKSKFAVLLPILIGALVNKIIAETHIDPDKAFDGLYHSELYTMLERESTKVWTFSVPLLFDLYCEEQTTGKLVLPHY